MSASKCWAGFAALLLVTAVAGQDFPENVPAGTRLRVKLETPVDTKTSRAGDGVRARLTEPVMIQDRVLLPVDTYLTGRVAVVRPANRKEHVSAVLNLAFEKITLPDGRVLQGESTIQSLGTMLRVDREGAVTEEEVSKGEAAGVVGTSAAAGAGVGAIAGGGKGAAIGAGVGGVLATLGALAAASAQWDDIELKKGRKMWLRLNQDLALPRARPSGQEPPAVPPQSVKPAAASARAPAAAATPVLTSEPAAPRSTERRVLVADRKAWEASGGFASNIGLGAASGEREFPAPKDEFLKAFQKYCPTLIMTRRPERAEYAITLERRGWHSPPYRVEVLSREGDVIYSGGTQFLRNAVRNACNAVLAIR